MPAAIPLPYSVLIVEDELAIAENILLGLETERISADISRDAASALWRLAQTPYDLVILDIGLPGMDGYRLLQHMRQDQQLATPILVISARSALEDKILGFSCGADDYLTKPFALEEMLLRVKALLRRTKQLSDTAFFLQYGPLQYMPADKAFTLHGQPLRLPKKCTMILEMLMRHAGRVVTKQKLEDYLWQGEPPSAEALRSQIHILRKTLTAHGFDGVETVHGTGWRLGSQRVPP